VCEHRPMADRPRTAFALVLALAALAMSGCSGTNSTAGSTSATSTTGSGALATRAQFIAQAASICQGVRSQEKPLKARQEALKSLPAAESEKEFVSLANQAASISRSADARLRALARPPADAHTIERLLQAYTEEANDASTLASAATRQESDLGESATLALAKSIATYSASAKSLGMGDCFAGE